MLDAGREALEFVENETLETLRQDRKTLLAIVKAIEIIGEAAAKISQPFQETHPEIPWPQIIGMRNRLIHAYFDIEIETVWQTVQDDLPPLMTTLEHVLESDDEMTD